MASMAGSATGLTGSKRVYERLARQLIDELARGQHKVGDRLPGERELAIEYQVSRPAVREAMIALEVQGFGEVRSGSGAYVRRLPGRSEDRTGFNATAFEVTEARARFEGEAAALAAPPISEEELSELDVLVAQMRRSDLKVGESEAADRSFHLLIAKATRDSVVSDPVERLCQLRNTSPDCVRLHEKSRDAENRPVPDEHNAIAAALRRGDANAARTAMHAHLSQVIEYLLFATEEPAVAEARRSVASTRKRYSGSLQV